LPLRNRRGLRWWCQNPIGSNSAAASKTAHLREKQTVSERFDTPDALLQLLDFSKLVFSKGKRFQQTDILQRKTIDSEHCQLPLINGMLSSKLIFSPLKGS